jgi:hypothetical protein
MTLENWKSIWDDVRATVTRSMAHESGVEISADSHWALTKLIVQKFERRSSLIQGIDRGGQAKGNDDMSELGASGLLDFMALEADCDNYGAHLRKILGR